MIGFLRDFGNSLDTRGTGTNYTNTFARKRHFLVWPATSVIALAGKVIDARVVGSVGDKQRADRADQKLRRGGLIGAGFNGPSLGAFIVTRIAYPGLELDILLQVKALGDVFEVSKHRRSRGLGFGPLPFINELLGERIGVEGAARRIDPGPRIPVVPPGASYAAGAIECADVEPHLVTQVVQRVHAAKARTNDYGVVLCRVRSHLAFLFRR